MAITRFFINDIPFRGTIPLVIPKSLAPGETLEIKIIGEPPLEFGRIKIVDDTDGVVFRGLARQFTAENRSSGNNLNAYQCTDLSPTLEYKEFSSQLVGTLNDVLILAQSRANLSLPMDFRCSNAARYAQIQLSIKDKFFVDALKSILASSGFALQYNISATGSLEIVEIGFGGLAPFEYVIEDENGYMKTANMKIVGRPKFTRKLQKASKIKVRGKNADLRADDGNSDAGRFIRTFAAAVGQNSYPLTGGADLEAVMLQTVEMGSGATPENMFQIWVLPNELTIGVHDAALYAIACTSANVDFNLAVPNLTLDMVPFPSVPGSATLAAPLSPGIFSTSKIVKINDDGYAGLTLQSMDYANPLPVGDYTLTIDGTVTVGMKTLTSQTTFTLHVMDGPGNGGPDPCASVNCYLHYDPMCCSI